MQLKCKMCYKNAQLGFGFWDNPIAALIEADRVLPDTALHSALEVVIKCSLSLHLHPKLKLTFEWMYFVN